MQQQQQQVQQQQRPQDSMQKQDVLRAWAPELDTMVTMLRQHMGLRHQLVQQEHAPHAPRCLAYWQH